MPTIADELRRVDLLTVLDDASIERLSEATHTRRLSRGQILFSEGEPTGPLFIVRRGRLRVAVSSPHGEELVLRILEEGDAFGEVSLLAGEPRSASVDALEDSELLAVPAEKVRQELLDNPQALLALTAQLASTIRHLTYVAGDLVFLDVPRRLAKLLVSEAVTGHDGVVVCELNMSQSGVAARLGATRQSLNRALGEFTRRSWISIDGTRVRLDDKTALSRYAGS